MVVTALAELAWMSDAVMCISKSSADDYAEFCRELQVPCPPLEVFRLGDAERGARFRGLCPAFLKGKRFVLLVSSIEPRKNQRLLYNAWDDLARDPTFPDDVVLAIVGASQWMSKDLIREMELNPTVKDRIVLINDADDSQLHALYAECLFTVFPSFYEGWGLPVAESLGAGKICLASDRGSIPEISALTVMLSPYDHAAWCDAIRSYVTDEPGRVRLERKIRDEFRPTSWEHTARSFFRGGSGMPRKLSRLLVLGVYPITSPMHGGQRRLEQIVATYRSLGVECLYLAVYPPFAHPTEARRSTYFRSVFQPISWLDPTAFVEDVHTGLFASEDPDVAGGCDATSTASVRHMCTSSNRSCCRSTRS